MLLLMLMLLFLVVVLLVVVVLMSLLVVVLVLKMLMVVGIMSRFGDMVICELCDALLAEGHFLIALVENMFVVSVRVLRQTISCASPECSVVVLALHLSYCTAALKDGVSDSSFSYQRRTSILQYSVTQLNHFNSQ